MPESFAFIYALSQTFLDKERQKVFPKLTEKHKFKAYRLQGSKYGAHESIVFTNDEINFFTVELGIITFEGQRHISPICQTYTGPKEKLHHVGELSETSQTLLDTAVSVLQKFGHYFKLLNNCRHFCIYYLIAVGLLDDDGGGLISGSTRAVLEGIRQTLVSAKESIKNTKGTC